MLFGGSEKEDFGDGVGGRRSLVERFLVESTVRDDGVGDADDSCG